MTLNSPVAEGRPLERLEITPGLIAQRCPQTGGVWIGADAYWRWLQRHPERLARLPEPSPAHAPVAMAGTDREPKLCPVSGTIMTRYRVGHGFEFHVERSAIGGIWLDGGEWEALKARNFHDELHLIFTAPWQRQLREQEQDAGAEARLIERLGDDLFARLQAMRKDLESHPARSEALSYLGRGGRAPS